MRRSLRLAAATAALFILIPAAGVRASPPQAVHFDVPTQFAPGDTGPTSGPFTATGPAVDAGVVCETGATVDVFGRVAAYQSPAGVVFQVVKLFTCDDGSGSFLVKLQVRIDIRGDNFQWMILDGSDAYARLRGTGSGIGVPFEDGSGVLDIYDGGVHLD
jgi:hypothetical protein